MRIKGSTAINLSPLLITPSVSIVSMVWRGCMSRYIPPPRHHRCCQAQPEAAPLTSSHYHCFSALDQVFDQAFPLLFLPPLRPALGPGPCFHRSESRWVHGMGFPRLPCGLVVAIVRCPGGLRGILPGPIWMDVDQGGPSNGWKVCFNLFCLFFWVHEVGVCPSVLRALFLLALLFVYTRRRRQKNSTLCTFSPKQIQSEL